MTETLNDAATDPQQTIAELQRKLAERTAERDELLQQRTATADVLKVISRSAFDLESALVNVCETAARLCDADQAAIYRRERDLYHFAASFGFPQEYADAWRAAGPAPNDPKSPLVGHRAVAERRPVQVLDVTADPAFLGSTSRASQSRTALGIPLMREGKPVGNFVLARQRVEAFTDRQLELMQTFADQASIAIENTRLFNETRDALERQTATADIQKVIASSPSDVQPVFEAIAQSAKKLISGALSGTVFPVRRRSNPYRGNCVDRFEHGRKDQSFVPSTASRLLCYRPHSRRSDRPLRGYRSGRRAAHPTGSRKAPWLSRHSARAAHDQRGHDRDDCDLAQGPRRFFRSPHGAAADFCRPGRDRDRECPAVRRGAAAHP